MSTVLSPLHKTILNNFDASQIQTPCFVVFEDLLEYNLKILKKIRLEAGCKILLALKCFSMAHTFPLISRYLDGVCASGSYEARLGHECFEGEVHVFSPAYTEKDIEECAPLADHLICNSLEQFQRMGLKACGLNDRLKLGLRVNPEHSETIKPLYDPCSAGSRLGITSAQLGSKLPDRISGLHFHTLCEMGADALERTLEVFEKKFAVFFKNLSWVNFGGGHHITRDDYNLDHLVRIIQKFKGRYPHLEVYLEPGEAVALNAGILIASALDITTNENTRNCILDASAVCHMPDVLEVPYRPEVYLSGKPFEKDHTYQLGGCSCLAGDVMGKYSFDYPLKIGDRVSFLDMAIYSMVKTNTFNGIKLPNIYYAGKNGKVELVREFGYEDFKLRV